MLLCIATEGPLIVVARLRRQTYRDSVELMRLSAQLAARRGVRQVSAMMATPANLELLRQAGLLTSAAEEARPNDLYLAAEAEDAAAAEAALAEADRLLLEGRGIAAAKGGLASAHSLRGALQLRPDLNLALISVPGEYAAAEALQALRSGLHVMLFSDNVPIEQEVALKEEAGRLGLLCMGPDCGTAIIGGQPLGFANRVRRGRIGLVGASGTGLQAVTCQIHQLGEGVSHALGSGGRDLSAEVGGRTTLAALETLAEDPATEVLVIISKPGSAEVEQRVMARSSELGKPTVFHFLGRSEPPDDLPPGSAWAGSLEEAGRAAVALARGERVWSAVDHAWLEDEGRRLAARSGPGTLAGLFSGGTLATEAGRILGETLGRLTDNGHHPAGEVARIGGHLVLDLGDDAYTRGKPHPLIDPAARGVAIEQAVAEGAGILLLDLVLGYGGHTDPAGVLVPILKRAREVAAGQGRRLGIVVGVVGTDQDPQPAAEQCERLRQAGAEVYETPTTAARVAAHAAALLQPLE